MATAPPLAWSLAEAVRVLPPAMLGAEVVAKVQTNLLDLLGCAFEARELPWSQQALRVVGRSADGAHLIGMAQRAPHADAVFVNAVLGHGLVREDMHAGSISHLGVVVLPVLLALSEGRRISGRAFIAATVAGYEVGARLGRALFTTELARLYRPTGITGPIGAAAAAGCLLGLDSGGIASAIGLAANTVAGLNQWPHEGGSEMYFHAGFAARSAITAVQLAAAGAFASERSLDGEAGLFAAYRRDAFVPSVVPFADGLPEILAVYNKPVPACNFAQSACQAALCLVQRDGVRGDAIRAIRIRVPHAAAHYPGCDNCGPFDRPLQTKMSIQFSVAAVLLHGCVEEANYRLPVPPALQRLLGVTRLEEDADFTAAFPGRQAAAVEVELQSATIRRQLDDVVAATPAAVRSRFRNAAADALGAGRAAAILHFVDNIENCDDFGALGALVACGNSSQHGVWMK